MEGGWYWWLCRGISSHQERLTPSRGHLLSARGRHRAEEHHPPEASLANTSCGPLTKGPMLASRPETFRRIGLWRETMAVTTGHGRSWRVTASHGGSWQVMAGIIILSIDGMGSGPPEMRLLSAPGRPFAQVRQVTSRACEDGRIIGTASPVRATPVLGPPSPPHRLKQPTVKSSILRSCRVTIHWPRKVISQHQ